MNDFYVKIKGNKTVCSKVREKQITLVTAYHASTNSTKAASEKMAAGAIMQNISKIKKKTGKSATTTMQSKQT